MMMFMFERRRRRRMMMMIFLILMVVTGQVSLTSSEEHDHHRHHHHDLAPRDLGLSACAPPLFSYPTRLALLPDWLVIYNNPFVQTLVQSESGTFFSSNSSCFRKTSNVFPSQGEKAASEGSEDTLSAPSSSSNSLSQLIFGTNRTSQLVSQEDCVPLCPRTVSVTTRSHSVFGHPELTSLNDPLTYSPSWGTNPIDALFNPVYPPLNAASNGIFSVIYSSWAAFKQLPPDFPLDPAKSASSSDQNNLIALLKTHFRRIFQALRSRGTFFVILPRADRLCDRFRHAPADEQSGFSGFLSAVGIDCRNHQLQRLLIPRHIRELMEDVGFVEIQKAEHLTRHRGQLFIDTLSDIFLTADDSDPEFSESSLTFSLLARKPSAEDRVFLPIKELLDASRTLMLNREFGESAIGYAREALLASPFDPESHNLYALLLENREQWGTSLRHFYASHLLDPSSAVRKTNIYNALHSYAIHFLRTHQISRALFHLYLLAELWPLDLSVWSSISEAHKQLGQITVSVQIIESILALNRSYAPGIDSGVFEMYEHLHQYDKALVLALELLNTTTLDAPGVFMSLVIAYRNCMQLGIWFSDVCTQLRYQALEKVKSHLNQPEYYKYSYISSSVQVSDLLNLGLSLTDISKALKDIYNRIDTEPEAHKLRAHFWKGFYPNATSWERGSDPGSSSPMPLHLRIGHPVNIEKLRIGFLFDPDCTWSLDWTASILSKLDGDQSMRFCFSVSSEYASMAQSKERLFQIDTILSQCTVVDLTHHDTPGRALHILKNNLHILLDVLTLSQSTLAQQLLAVRLAPIQIGVLGTEVLVASPVTAAAFLADSPQRLDLSAREPYLNPILVNRIPVLSADLRLKDIATQNDMPANFTIGLFVPSVDITPLVVTTLMKILRRIPTARVMLKEPDMPVIKQNFLRSAISANISVDRFIWQPGPIGLSKIYELRGDLSCIWATRGLSAISTTIHALWAGIPVLFRHTSSHYSNIIATALMHTDTVDGICESWKNFEETLIRWAESPSLLRNLRLQLIQSRQTSALWNTSLGVSIFQKTVVEIWQKASASRGFTNIAPNNAYPEHELRESAARLTHWQDRWMRDSAMTNLSRITYISLRDAQDQSLYRMTKTKLRQFEFAFTAPILDPPLPFYSIPEAASDTIGLYVQRASLLSGCNRLLAFQLSPNGLPLPSPIPVPENNAPLNLKIPLLALIQKMQEQCVMPTLPSIDLDYDLPNIGFRTLEPIPDLVDTELIDNNLLITHILSEREEKTPDEEQLFFGDMFPSTDGDPLALMRQEDPFEGEYYDHPSNFDEIEGPAEPPSQPAQRINPPPVTKSDLLPSPAETRPIQPSERKHPQQLFPPDDIFRDISSEQFQTIVHLVLRHWESVSSRALGPLTSQLGSWFQVLPSLSHRWIVFQSTKLDQLEADLLKSFTHMHKVLNSTLKNNPNLVGRDQHANLVRQVADRMTELLSSCRFVRMLLVHIESQHGLIAAIVRKFVTHSTHIDRMHAWIQNLHTQEVQPLNLSGVVYTFRTLDKLRLLHDMETAAYNANMIYAQHTISVIDSIEADIRKSFRKLKNQCKEYLLSERWDNNPYGKLLLPSHITDYDDPHQLFPWYPSLLDIVEERHRSLTTRWQYVQGQHDLYLKSMYAQVQKLLDLDELLTASISCSESSMLSIGLIDSLASPLLSHLTIEQFHRRKTFDFTEIDHSRRETLAGLKTTAEVQSAACSFTIQQTIEHFVSPSLDPIVADFHQADFRHEQNGEVVFLRQLHSQLKTLVDELGTRLQQQDAKLINEVNAIQQLANLRKELDHMRRFAAKAQASMNSEVSIAKLEAMLQAAETEQANLRSIRQSLKDRVDSAELDRYEGILNSLITTVSSKIEQYSKNEVSHSQNEFANEESRTVYTGGHAIPDWIARVGTTFVKPENTKQGGG